MNDKRSRADNAPRPRTGSVRRAALALMLCIATVAQAHAADDASATLSLAEALRLAVGQSALVQAAMATADSVAAAAPAAGALPDPELIVGIDNLPIEGDERFSLTDDFMTMRRIGVMQSFPGPGKRRLRQVRAERDVDLAQAAWRQRRFDAGRAAAEAWIDAARARATAREFDELTPLAELQAATSRAALASGRASTADALAAATAVAALADRRLALDNEAELARAELARWLGADAARPLAPLPVDAAQSEPRIGLADLERHAPLAVADAAVAAARADVELARAEKRPDWSTELVYSRRGARFGDMVSLQFRIGLPLFTARRQDPLVAGRLAAVRASEAELAAERQRHRAELDATLANWHRDRERLRRYDRDLLPLARERREIASAAYAAGRGELREALESIAAEADLRVARVELQASLVRSWAFLELLHETEESR